MGALGVPASIESIGTKIGGEQAVNILSKSFITNALGGGTASVVEEVIGKVAKTNENQLVESFGNISLDIIFGIFLGAISSKIKIPKIDSGRNSFQAIFYSGIRKLVNGTGRMHLKTFLKGIASKLPKSVGKNLAYSGIESIWKISEEIYDNCFNGVETEK